MNKKKNEKKTLLVEGIIFLILLSIFILYQILKTNVEFCEWYSITIGRFFQVMFGMIVKYFPISLTENYFIFLIIFSITLLVKSIKLFSKHKGINGAITLNKVILMIFATVTIYNAACTLEYNRKPVPVPMYNGEVKKEEYEDIIRYFMDDFNYCSSLLTYDEKGEIKSEYSLQKLNKIFENEYKRMQEIDDKYFTSFTSFGKPMISSFIYRELWITGVYFAPFGESNINMLQTNAELPFTIAHELAHSKGIIRENDANMVALYLTLTSDNYYLRYSGYINWFTSLFNISKYSDDKSMYSRLAREIDPNIFKNWNYMSKYWDEHDLANRIGDFINDLYLKLQGTKNGSDDYSDTPVITDPDTNTVISFSNYQKIFLNIYYTK